MRVIVYLRISSDPSGLAAGVTRQREDCEAKARDRNWSIVAVECDNDMSASSGRRRPGFEAVLDALTAKRADVVLAWSLDRLQRNRRDELRLIEACQQAGATLALVNGADLDFSTAAGRFVADSLGSVARFEIELKSDRQKRATLQAAQEGRRTGGRRPFGYDDDGTTIRPAEADAVRDGYRALLSGVPLGEIARTWNGAGLSTGQRRWKGEHRGELSQWRHDNVGMVLRNPRYAGLRAHLGEIMGPAQWPALVDESTWRAAVAILSDPRRRTATPSSRALLSGLAVCGVCGATVHGGGSARPGVRGVRCSTNLHFCRMAVPVEDYVERYLIERLSEPDARELLTNTTAPDLDALREQAVAIRSRLDSLAVDFAEGDLTAGQVRIATARLRENLAAVEAKMADAGRVDILGALVGADDVASVWYGLSTARKRAAIACLYRVHVHPPGRGVSVFRPESVTMERLTD